MSGLVSEDECIYSIIGVSKDASTESIAKRYRKLALIYHPDRHANKSMEQKEEMKNKFQRLSFAYDVLRDEKRREIYDSTGNFDILSDISDLDEYFREIYKSSVTIEAIEAFKRDYQGSEEEKADIHAAYIHHKGDMNGIFEEIVCSEILADETRFREIIDAGIEAGELESFDNYVHESEEKKQERIDSAKEEAHEAEIAAKELGIGEITADSLQSMILKNQQDRMKNQEAFLDKLEAKYTESSPPARRRKSETPNRRSSRLAAKEQTPVSTPKRKSTTPLKPKEKRRKKESE